MFSRNEINLNLSVKKNSSFNTENSRCFSYPSQTLITLHENLGLALILSDPMLNSYPSFTKQLFKQNIKMP